MQSASTINSVLFTKQNTSEVDQTLAPNCEFVVQSHVNKLSCFLRNEVRYKPGLSTSLALILL
jgi:hypothetical protein